METRQRIIAIIAMFIRGVLGHDPDHEYSMQQMELLGEVADEILLVARNDADETLPD